MSSPEPVLDSVNIVVKGSLNPLIFQPAWFSAQGLLRPQEAEAAVVEIIHPDIVSFKTDWMKLQVTRDHLAAHTLQQHAYEPLRDLVAETFRLLSHTPLTGLGMNWEGHFQLNSAEEWHAFGHKLAPKEHWNPVLKAPKTVSLTVRGERPDAYAGFILAKVEASTEVKPDGIFVSINDHFDGTVPAPGRTGCETLMEILVSGWTTSIKRSKGIALSLIGGA